MEKDYSDYLKQTEEALKEVRIKESASLLKPLGKFFRNDHGKWEPMFYPGYTIITPTFSDDMDNFRAYALLGEIARKFIKRLDLPALIAAPCSAMHMTVARLISGDEFLAKVRNARENDELLAALDSVSRQVPANGPWKFEIKGLTIYPQGVIAALLSPSTEADYQKLQDFRNLIYENDLLKEKGVERKRSFQGHITLAYIEEELEAQEGMSLANRLIEINQRFSSNPLQFEINRPEVRKFENFLKFHRQAGWPVVNLI